MNYVNVSVSLPMEVAELADLVSKRDKRSRSAVIGEAIKLYIDALDIVEKPTVKEIKAIKEGREAFKRGKYRRLDEMLHEMGITDI